LIAFGGAGPLHAARLARELDIGRILVPRNPGILCAMGLLLTDLRADFAITRLRPLVPDALPDIKDAFKTLDARAEAWFDDEAIALGNRGISRTIDMRYAGQNYELSVPLPDGAIDASSLAFLAEGFASEHRRLYGFAADDEPVQMVTFRVEATGLVPKAGFTPKALTGSDAARAVTERRLVWLQDTNDFTLVPVYDRDRLEAGDQFNGPAIVEQMDATTFVAHGMTARVDTWLNLILEFV
jgi:N-methylhydantoinase A